MTESGLPQLALTFSAGVLAPAGTPEPILDTLNAAFREALKSPELVASMAKLGFAAGAMDAAAIRRLPRRRDEEVAADREGVRREGGVTRAMRRLALAIVAMLATGFGAAPAQAQQYPDKPIKLDHPAGRRLADHGAGARGRAAAVGAARAAGRHREPARRPARRSA